MLYELFRPPSEKGLKTLGVHENAEARRRRGREDNRITPGDYEDAFLLLRSPQITLPSLLPT
jgi:hypothetical protein